MSPSRREFRTVFGVAAVIVAVGCLLILAVNGEFEVRTSADSADTVPMWKVWLPPALGVLAVLVFPPGRSVKLPVIATPPRAGIEGGALAALAIIFAGSIIAVGGSDPAYVVMKIGLLFIVPGVVLVVGRRRGGPAPPISRGHDGWWAVAPVAVWAVVEYGTSLAPPPADPSGLDLATVVVILAVGFLLNAVIEEVFYRRWLQTRLEATIGVPAAIGWASILWAVWHAGIQGVGGLDVDVAAAIAQHLPMGVFLGLLWTRYRRMWPLFTVHGLLNSVPIAIGLAA